MDTAFEAGIRRIERELAERMAREAPVIRRGLEYLGTTVVDTFVEANRMAEGLFELTRNGMRPADRP